MSKDARVYCAQGPEFINPTAEGTLSNTSFVFKDLFDVGGYVTGAGNPTWLATHQPAEKTSPLIVALLAQGAKCVGRVQTDELAYSLNGQNIHYGTPQNPLAPECIPGGSSSGSAVAVARGDADFAIGTDTGGSVRVPASYCGLFGLRPTLHKLDLSHCFELAGSFDTAGVFAKTLPMLNQAFATLCAAPQPGQIQSRLFLDDAFSALLGKARLERLQTWCQTVGVSLIRGDVLAKNGWQLDALSELFRTIQGFEIIRLHGEWLSQHGDSLDPAIAARVEWSRQITPEQYQAAQAEQAKFAEQIHSAIASFEGVWVLPTTPSGPPRLDMPADELAIYRSQLMGMTSVAGLSGLPQLHIPMNGLEAGPCGISLIGAAQSEGDLIASAMVLTQSQSSKQSNACVSEQ